MDMHKEYRATIDLHAFSETDDAERTLHPISVDELPPLHIIKQTLTTFIGEQQQIPPKYSAVKVHGVPRYKEARAGKADIKLPPRLIIVHDITLISYAWPELVIDISCSKGTYIRSLARDIGIKLGTGGYIKDLCRTGIGPYTLADAHDIQTLTTIEDHWCLSQK